MRRGARLLVLKTFLLVLPAVQGFRPNPMQDARPGSFLGVSLRQAEPRVAFLVKTDSAFYDTRLQWVRGSWAKDVDPELLLVAGDRPHDGVLDTKCKAHSHGQGLCCKFAVALQHMVTRRGKPFDWIAVVDDDAYVNVAGMQAALRAHGAPGRSMLGIVGCGAGTCWKGFCGGGTYMLSREAAEELVSSAPQQQGGFYGEFMDACQNECKDFEDITVAKLGRRRGIEPEQLGGLHAWPKLKTEQIQKELGSCHPEPLTFHYLRSEREFQEVHKYVSANVRKCLGNATLPTVSGAGLVELMASLRGRGDAAGRYGEGEGPLVLMMAP